MPSRAEGPVTPETAATHREAVERAVQVMNERYHEPLSLDDLAKAAYMSPYHFNRVFHRVTGIPPGRFLSALRLRKAAGILAESDLSVTEVCYEVGYNSLGTFSRRFKEATLMSPGELRRLARKEDEPEVDLTKVVGAAVEVARRSRREVPAAAVEGEVVLPADTEDATVFIGLFKDRLPESRPLACTIRDGSGNFHLDGIPDGEYHVFAAAVPSASGLDDVTGNMVLRSEIQSSGVRIVGGRSESPVQLLLRGSSPFDPPILTFFPFLLRQAEFMAGARLGGNGHPNGNGNGAAGQQTA